MSLRIAPAHRVQTVDVLAHNGGIDEIGLVLGPIAIMAGLLWLANRRAMRLEAEAKARVPADTDAEETLTEGGEH